jgi:iron complex transport system substrate-binding protein
VLIFSACSKQPKQDESATPQVETGSLEEDTAAPEQTEEDQTESTSEEAAEDSATQSFTYQSENGPLEVPLNPQRIVVLNTFVSGSVMALQGNIVGIDTWSMANPQYEQYLTDTVEVSDESLEQIIELEPDLIIAAPTNNNIDKLSQIAPTVTYTYGKVDYLTQVLEVGKLINKEQEAVAWIEDYQARAKATGEEIKAKIGEDATVSVIESFDKQLYVYGANWGRGTEILYQEMKLNMPEKVKAVALEAGYFALSPEVLSEYAGDYVIFSKSSTADHSFQETKTYQNIPAVKNNRVFEFDAAQFYFNDPITLDYQLEQFKLRFLGN